MDYLILAEAHEGVASVDWECWDVINTFNATDAMSKYSSFNHECKLYEETYYCRARKLFAVENDTAKIAHLIWEHSGKQNGFAYAHWAEAESLQKMAWKKKKY